ncbi:unnamed protein product, partial [Amoebophrya sp. A120]|eukprot:GSA120T00015763001.1
MVNVKIPNRLAVNLELYLDSTQQLQEPTDDGKYLSDTGASPKICIEVLDEDVSSNSLSPGNVQSLDKNNMPMLLPLT